MKLTETQYPQMYSKALVEEKLYDIPPEFVDKIVDVVFTGTSYLLAQTKSKEKPATLCFRKVDESLVAAATVRYFEGETKDDLGNWSLSWTFNEEDIPEDAYKMDFATQVQTHSYFRSAAGERYGMRFDDSASLVDCLTYALIQLKKWLDENAKEGTEVMIEQDGIFQARVAIENGEKVFAIEPAGEIKVLIKDDAAIEK